MLYYGNYDDLGKYIGFYIVDVHGDSIPIPNIELTEAEWQEALTGDYKVINNKHIYIPVTPTEKEVRTQKLYSLDAEYQPQFAELSQALGIASLSNSTSLITSIKADYADLKDEYDTKRGEISGS